MTPLPLPAIADIASVEPSWAPEPEPVILGMLADDAMTPRNVRICPADQPEELYDANVLHAEPSSEYWSENVRGDRDGVVGCA